MECALWVTLVICTGVSVMAGGIKGLRGGFNPCLLRLVGIFLGLLALLALLPLGKLLAEVSPRP